MFKTDIVLFHDKIAVFNNEIKRLERMRVEELLKSVGDAANNVIKEESLEVFHAGSLNSRRLNFGTTCTNLGTNAGLMGQQPDATAIGNEAGETNQGQFATAVGSGAGNNNQGVLVWL